MCKEYRMMDNNKRIKDSNWTVYPLYPKCAANIPEYQEKTFHTVLCFHIKRFNIRKWVLFCYLFTVSWCSGPNEWQFCGRNESPSTTIPGHLSVWGTGLGCWSVLSTGFGPQRIMSTWELINLTGRWEWPPPRPFTWRAISANYSNTEQHKARFYSSWQTAKWNMRTFTLLDTELLSIIWPICYRSLYNVREHYIILQTSTEHYTTLLSTTAHYRT